MDNKGPSDDGVGYRDTPRPPDRQSKADKAIDGLKARGEGSATRRGEHSDTIMVPDVEIDRASESASPPDAIPGRVRHVEGDPESANPPDTIPGRVPHVEGGGEEASSYLDDHLSRKASFAVHADSLEKPSMTTLYDAAKDIDQTVRAGGVPDGPSIRLFARCFDALIAAIDDSMIAESGDPHLARQLKLVGTELASQPAIDKAAVADVGKVVGGLVLLIDVTCTGGLLTLHKLTFEQAAVLIVGGGAGASAIQTTTKGVEGLVVHEGNEKRRRENEKRRALLEQLIEAARIVIRARDLQQQKRGDQQKDP